MKLAPFVIFHRCSDGREILLVPVSNRAIALNHTGAFICRMLTGEGASAECIAEALAVEFALKLPQAQHDTEAFLNAMLRKDLLQK